MNLRVCYLLPRLLPGKSGVIVGGCAANCVSLAFELKRQGVDIELLAPISQDELEFLMHKPITEILTPLPYSGRGLIGRGAGSLYNLRCGLRARLKEKRFNVIHSHSGTYPYAIVPLTADKNACVRLHSLYCPLGSKGGVYSRWWDKPRVAGFIFNKLDKIIAVSDNVFQSIEKTGVSSQKVEYVPMCVDNRIFSPRPRKGQLKYFPDKDNITRILFIGNSSKEKGLIELLQALRLLALKEIPVYLVAALENQSKIRDYEVRYDYVKKLLVQPELADKVRILGLVENVEQLYQETELVVIPWNTSRGPSDYPMVALEAMAMGKCIVSTPVGGCPQLLKKGKAGILTNGFSAQSIASALEFAIKNPQLQAKIRQAAIEAANDFSLQKTTKQMIVLYEQLITKKALA